MMIPDCRQRLESALSELHTAVEDAKRDADGVEEEQREAAMEVMAAAEKVLENASPSEKTESDDEADEAFFKRIAHAVEKMLEPMRSAEMRQCQTQGDQESRIQNSGGQALSTHHPTPLSGSYKDPEFGRPSYPLLMCHKNQE